MTLTIEQHRTQSDVNDRTTPYTKWLQELLEDTDAMITNKDNKTKERRMWNCRKQTNKRTNETKNKSEQVAMLQDVFHNMTNTSWLYADSYSQNAGEDETVKDKTGTIAIDTHAQCV